MKHTFYLLLSFVLLLTACQDDTSSTVSIHVTNLSGVAQSNVVVYEFSAPATSQYGSDPVYANKLVETDKQGVAKFTIDGFEYTKNNNTEATLYFTIFKETVSTTGYTVLATDSVTFKKGALVSRTLILVNN
jgi:hypothetical protein